MSRAQDYLKEVIAACLGPHEVEAFWYRYNELRRIDNHDSTAKSMRKELRIAEQELRYPNWPSQVKYYTNQRDRARAWLQTYGYSETETDVVE